MSISNNKHVKKDPIHVYNTELIVVSSEKCPKKCREMVGDDLKGYVVVELNFALFSSFFERVCFSKYNVSNATEFITIVTIVKHST